MAEKLFVSMIALSLILCVHADAGAQTESTSTDYRFGPEDVIDIQVWGRPDLTGTVVVDFDGQIQIPLLGEIRAEGRSPGELGEDLTQRFQILDPTVSEVLVSVAEYHALGVTVLGEVRSPGPYGFREMPNLWEAILTAGGPTREAELAGVQIIRGEQRVGEPHSITVNLSRGIDQTPPDSLPPLRPGDKILVPAIEERPVVGDNYHVLGEVNAPGTYRINTARNVIEALAVSGGPGPDADLKKVALTRPTELGAVSYRLDVEGYLYAAYPPANFDLRAGDTITVPEKATFWTWFSEFSGRLIPWISLTVTIILATR